MRDISFQERGKGSPVILLHGFPMNSAVWDEFAKKISYCMGEFSDAEAYKKLEQMLSAYGNEQLRHNLLFYLATSPSQFGEVAELRSNEGQ